MMGRCGGVTIANLRVRRRSAMADNWQPSTKLPQDWWISVFTALSSQDADYLDADDVSSVRR